MSKIILAEQASAPDTPGSGKVAIFVDTNGDLAWKDDAGNVIKIAAAGSYTLTIPATGTAALRDVAQTFSAAQTFSDALVAPGMKPAADSTTALQLQKNNGTAVLTVDTTNSKVDVAALKINGVDVPYAAGTWTPVLRFGGATTGITYAALTGVYVRIGGLLFFDLTVALTSKGTATGAATIAGLPVVGVSNGGVFPRYLASMVGIIAPIIGLISGTVIGLQSGFTAGADLTEANFSNSSNFQLVGIYTV